MLCLTKCVIWSIAVASVTAYAEVECEKNIAYVNDQLPNPNYLTSNRNPTKNDDTSSQYDPRIFEASLAHPISKDNSIDQPIKSYAQPSSGPISYASNLDSNQKGQEVEGNSQSINDLLKGSQRGLTKRVQVPWDPEMIPFGDCEA